MWRNLIFKDLGRLFPLCCHFRVAMLRESLSVCSQQRVLYSVWSTWEIEVKIARIKWFSIQEIGVGQYPFPYICCCFPYWLLAHVPTWIKDTFQQFIISRIKWKLGLEMTQESELKQLGLLRTAQKWKGHSLTLTKAFNKFLRCNHRRQNTEKTSCLYSLKGSFVIS